MSVSGSPGVPEGPRSLLFREESRGTPSKGFIWATSSRRLDTALLSCAKKRGVEPPRRNCCCCACRATEQKGCDPFDIPGVLISNCYPVERFYGFRQHSRSGLQLQTSLQLVQRSTCRAANMAVPTAARHFCSAKILAGGLRWGWGPQRSRE